MRYSPCRLERLPSSGGISPLNSLRNRNRCCRLERLPSSGGISPLSSFSERFLYHAPAVVNSYAVPFIEGSLAEPVVAVEPFESVTSAASGSGVSVGAESGVGAVVGAAVVVAVGAVVGAAVVEAVEAVVGAAVVVAVDRWSAQRLNRGGSVQRLSSLSGERLSSLSGRWSVQRSFDAADQQDCRPRSGPTSHRGSSVEIAWAHSGRRCK